MATSKLNFLEKMANTFGPVYRYQKLLFPRRFNILKKVVQRELAPPSTKDWPTIKRDFALVTQAIETRAYRNYTLGETLVYFGIAFEIICWFFVGECIGRQHFFGYVVPGNYVSKAIRKKSSELLPDDKTSF